MGGTEDIMQIENQNETDPGLSSAIPIAEELKYTQKLFEGSVAELDATQRLFKQSIDVLLDISKEATGLAKRLRNWVQTDAMETKKTRAIH